MTGFLDGINDSLKNPNPIETMEEDTQVNLDYDKEKLYYNMVGAKADWLYELPQWKEIFSEEELKKLEDAIAFRNVSNMPARVKCALLAWHTVEDMLNKNQNLGKGSIDECH